jgi:cytoskeletal protein CcmA (bactofilin family)
MFSKSKQGQDAALPMASGGAKGATFSVIGTDVLITGDIRATVDLHIDGRIQGDVACATLVQGESSHIIGAIEADQARLAGTVEGAITVKTLVIEAKARIKGDVSYETLSMAVGAEVDGRLTHINGAAVSQGLKLVTAAE